MRKGRKNLKAQGYYRRFPRSAQLLHALLVLSVLGLSWSGMALRFAWTAWARALAEQLGGAHALGLVHRGFALLLMAVFAMHLLDLVRKSRRAGGWKRLLLGPDSMLLGVADLRQLLASLRWFLWLGPRPRYGRYTYWEKFDYFAVFWGMFVIGSTGLILWFPALFARLLPGAWINVAQIIHSDEALLAVLFLFVVHFFNTHLRPDRFPMDLSIFTGYVPAEELERERPDEYARVRAEMGCEAMKGPSWRLRILAAVYGTLAVAAGLGLLLLVACELWRAK